MRLQRLEMAGTGSFADRIAIDFGSLSHAGLFLIEGPTGSGKSTILDAIVFALYGSVAGASSDVGRLDSHMRTDSPFVELDFEVAGRAYRVRRSPAHQRAKKRGEGTTDEKASATLLERTDGGWTELGHRASEVAENIQRIIGLDKEQFASTVVLAQGEFARFLDAGTGDRQQILERVFGTEFYKRVEDQLYVMRRQARDRRAKAQEMVDQAVHECCGILDLPSDGEDADLIRAVDTAIATIVSIADDVGRQVTAAEADLEKARAAHSDAVKLASDQARKRTHLAEQARLAARESQVSRARQTLAEHERAAIVAPVIEDRQVARDEDQRAAAQLDVALGRVVAAGEAPEAGRQRLTEVGDLLGQMRSPVLTEQALAGVQARVRELRTVESAARADVDGARTRLTAAQDDWQETASQLSAIPDQSQRMTDLALAVGRLETNLSDLKRAECLRRELRDAQESLLLSEQVLQKATERASLIEAERLQNQAAALAADLVDGQACRVCGATEHPHPAVAVEAGGDLVAARADESQARRAAQDARDEVVRLTAGLGEVAGDQLDLTVTEVEQQLAARLAEQSAVGAQQHRRIDLQLRLEELGRAKNDSANALAEARLALAQAQADLSAASSAAEQDELVVSAARAGFVSVAERVRALEAARDALDAAERARSVAEAATRVLGQADKALERSLRQSGFADAAAVRAVLLKDADRGRLAAEIQEWDEAMTRVGAALADLADVDLAQVVDTTEMASARDAAEASVRSLRDTFSRMSDRLGRVQPRRADLGRRLKAREHVRAETDAVIRMADLATASRTEVTHRVRLSAFVLMRRFEDVVNAANDRLGAISEGRYQLQVVTRGLDARAAAGLDLTIYDARSDSARSTRSLSGGERFYVSLALALGLADVVRSESGGVELGTLFIDEGFGSLDAEVLEEVMDMLEQVRVGEDRVIGLISHVEALKQRIDARISVQRDPARPGVSSLEVHV